MNIGGRSCQRYTKSGGGTQTGGVYALWIDTSNNNLPCRAEFDYGKKIDFDNFTAVTPDIFTEYTTWNCPQEKCYSMMDVMLVLDESDSVDNTSFSQLKDFAESIANSSHLSPEHMHMGAVFFGTDAR
jgi:hypothetical protein